MVAQRKGGKVSALPKAFIAVFGVTGAGKSTFVQTITEDQSVEVGHQLESCKLTAAEPWLYGYHLISNVQVLEK
jgi:ABC-type uncharacterized transport system ATPase component